MSEPRPPWSNRRRRLLLALTLAVVVTALAAIVLPGEYGVTAMFVGALFGFLLVVALVVFVTVPGPGTLGTLLRTLPLSGAVLVVAVLLVLSTAGEALRWLWILAAVLAAAWTATALWLDRQERRPDGG